MGRLARVGAFLQHMFPPLVTVPLGAANFASIYLGVQALAGQTPLRLTWRAGLGAASTVLFMLLMRVYDELKDAPADLRLGRAGDPRYANRPIVTGRITLDDLAALRWLITAALVLLNLPLGFPLPFAAFAVLFALMWLSFKWFFWPAMSRNILLAFLTHNPIALALGAYIAALAVVEFDLHPPFDQTAQLLLGLWMPAAAWETSRKIRMPCDETEYQTYSKVLGPRVAALLPAIFVAVSVAVLGPLAFRIHPALLGLFVLAAMIPVAGSLLFILAPTARRANLRPLSELYATLLTVSWIAALVWRFGLVTPPAS